MAVSPERESACPRLGWDGLADDEPCRVAELDHYGRPTGELFCYTHFAVVGTVDCQHGCNGDCVTSGSYVCNFTCHPEPEG